MGTTVSSRAVMLYLDGSNRETANADDIVHAQMVATAAEMTINGVRGTMVLPANKLADLIRDNEQLRLAITLVASGHKTIEQTTKDLLDAGVLEWKE